MKITRTTLKQIIQEEIAAVQEDFGSVPPAPSASREEVNKVVAELFNVAAKVEALGEDFFADVDSLDAWIGAFMEKHKVLQESKLEEGMFGLTTTSSSDQKLKDQRDMWLSRVHSLYIALRDSVGPQQADMVLDSIGMSPADLRPEERSRLEEDELEEAALEEGRCPPGHYWKSFGGQGGTCVKDPDYKGPKSAYSQGGTVSPPRGSYTPKYEE